MYRASLVATAVCAVVCAGIFVASSSARDDNEARLLEFRAVELANTFDSLVAGLETQFTSVAAIAGATGGDPARFAADVSASTEDLGEVSSRLLRIGPDGGLEVVASAGAPHPPEALDAPLLPMAFEGEFVVLGMHGEGLGRQVAVAAGTPGSPFVVYTEIPLIGALTSGSDGDGGAEAYAGLAAAFYLGDVAPENLIFALGEPSGRVATVATEAGHATITAVVATSEPLSGSLAHSMPLLLLAVGVVTSLGAIAFLERTLRGRDVALRAAEELRRSNAELDRALAARDEADRARDRLEGELRQTQRLEAVGQLAGGIAHDFNNLLAAILSYADLVAGDLGDHPSRADVAEIRGAARRGAALTRKLLQFSRDVPAVEEPVDVDAVVADVERLLSRTIGEDVVLTTDLDGSLPLVLADASSLEQVVLNLVVNARDALGPGGGSIVLRTDLVDVREDEHLGLAPGPHVRLRVVDDGAGMDEETASRAFEPFFTTKERGRGTGLGLATVYGAVQQVGGHVRVTSSPGEGSVFEILLPVLDEVAGGHAAGADDDAPAMRATNGTTVLLLEDEEAVREAARRMLERAGYAVIVASDGPGALLAHEQAGTIDVLLTDIILPGGMSGADVGDVLRSRQPSLPVLYMSGYSADILADRGIGADGAPSVLAKPFTREELLEAVGSALAAARVS